MNQYTTFSAGRKAFFAEDGKKDAEEKLRGRIFPYRLVLRRRKCYTESQRYGYGGTERKIGMDREKTDLMELSRDTAWMLRNVGEAMRESLNGSMAASELLSRRLEKREGEDDKVLLSILRHDQHKLLRIAENLTALGNLSLGALKPEEDIQDLDELCAELVDTVSALTDRVKLVFVPSGSNCTVNGSHDWLENMVLNILAYSLHRCREGDTVTIRTERRGGEVLIVFRDNAVCPEGKPIQSLYSALEQDPAGDIAQGGAGLGLLVAEGISRLHRGSLFLSEDPEKGMEAVVTLPKGWYTTLHENSVRYGSRIRGILTVLSGELSRDKYRPPYL